MKKLITLAAVVLMGGVAYAGCGVKISVEGKLSSYDPEKKLLEVDGQSITLAASADIKGAGGASAKIEDLVGKEVMISTDKHTKKGESVSLVGGSKDSKPAEKVEMKSNLLAESQDWTNASGVTITAAVQKVEGGKVYFLKDGKTIPYDVPKLSEETIGRLKAIIEKAK